MLKSIKRKRAVRRIKQRNFARKYKGNTCQICGKKEISFIKDPKFQSVLSFHHINKSSKNFDIAHNYGKVSWKKLIKELDKCDLLCLNCHRRIHKLEIKEELSGRMRYQNLIGFDRDVRSFIKSQKLRLKLNWKAIREQIEKKVPKFEGPIDLR